ncbi:2-amino-3,7-dideoxy-D-threo-hept-6-ulosonate synthase [Sporolactobacillus spathodeae]|uniref:Phospho-2-dehydro-3-deoxyheptonate aldolase n=1 Tax=Sporolactobacillus spathodeae TaxID=1465502 RepID=A0ABS2Q513_9BACL|nr:2-amino-3,7-dideoxy-D-threo-hept-6-ulosonate synthase [Sporolactobacillus spathodeae]MBM7656879.1 putative phospho-2-dehydro-3-deoxyheptonate aldolase [Sporolactobacillus spathodeae]
MDGKQLRMNRLFAEDKKMVMIPMDHGITLGPIRGIENIDQAVAAIDQAAVDSFVLHKGMVKSISQSPKASLIVHLSASTELGPQPLRKVQVCTVEEALRLGADAVSTHINFGSEYEAEQIVDTAEVAEACDRWGMPLLVMAYVRGENIDAADVKKTAHAVRIAAELGADIVKTSFPENAESMHEIVSATSLPTLVAGGGKVDDALNLFRMIEKAIQAGCAGVSIGRNVFSHRYPREIAQQLVRIVHHSVGAESAYEALTKVFENA